MMVTAEAVLVVDPSAPTGDGCEAPFTNAAQLAGKIAVIDRGGTRWVFLDAGVFTGLVETIEEAIRYPVTTSRDRDGGPRVPCVLAGPTCDSADVLYEQAMVHLPADLAEGDWVRLESAGAYTSCYSTVGFNGFPPLPTLLRA